MSYVNPADFLKANEASDNGEKHCVERTYADGTIATAPVSPKAVSACKPVVEAYALATDKQTVYLVRDSGGSVMFQLIPADATIELPLSLQGRFSSENNAVRAVRTRCDRIHRGMPVDLFGKAKRCPLCQQFHLKNQGCNEHDVPKSVVYSTLLELHQAGIETGVRQEAIEVERLNGFTILSTSSTSIQVQTDGMAAYAWSDNSPVTCTIIRPDQQWLRWVSLWAGWDMAYEREQGFTSIHAAVDHIKFHLGAQKGASTIFEMNSKP
jgi:hypothetical protein